MRIHGSGQEQGALILQAPVLFLRRVLRLVLRLKCAALRNEPLDALQVVHDAAAYAVLIDDRVRVRDLLIAQQFADLLFEGCRGDLSLEHEQNQSRGPDFHIDLLDSAHDHEELPHLLQLRHGDHDAVRCRPRH